MIIENKTTAQKTEGRFLRIVDDAGNEWRISDTKKGIMVQLINPANFKTHYGAISVEPDASNVVALTARRNS